MPLSSSDPVAHLRASGRDGGSSSALVGGTGKYENARGNLDLIGEVDLATNQVVLRYTGKFCLDDQE
ncbi:MAG: hypothetical protein ACJ74Z_21610 [Bryobacteraceae bacterium]